MYTNYFILTITLSLSYIYSTELKIQTEEKQCNNDKDCNNGTCFNFMCTCNFGFIDYTDNGIFKRCYYEQKSQMKAFLYELFINFGAGHFYLSNNKVGFLKMSAFIFGLLLICLFPLTIKFFNDRFESDFSVILFSCVYYYYVIGIAVWYIFDLVYFGMNSYRDSNGIPLRPW